jgi:hypothetical protein
MPPYPVEPPHGLPPLDMSVISVEGCWEEPVQLHNEEFTEKCWLDFHIDNSYPEDTNLGFFKGEILAHQWNETPVFDDVINGEEPIPEE